jgi:sarcosine oxidase subunit beta
MTKSALLSYNRHNICHCERKKLMQQPDVLIIGAGVIGCAVAFELAKKNYRVQVIDKNDEVGAGSTGNSCAIVRTCYSTYQGVAMAYEGLHYWVNWADYLETADERGLAGFVRCGMSEILAPNSRWERVKPFYDAIGIKYEEWSAAEAKEKLSIWDMGAFYPPSLPSDDAFWEEPTGEVPGVVFVPGEGYINDPMLATHNLRRAAEAYGAEFLLGRTVTAIHRDESRVLGVTLDGDTHLDAPVVVNVAGPHSYIINRMAGIEDSLNIKTQALRREVHFVPAPSGVDFADIGFVTLDSDNGIYFRPETGNLILVGSGDPPCDPRGWVDPDSLERGLTDERWEAQTYRLAKRFTGLGIPSQRRGIVDMYDVSDDWIPIYDKTDLNGFYLAIGTSGNQFKNAGVAGHLMAELIDACETGHNHDADPITITGRYTGLRLESGFYSRLRAINRESSFSVVG